MSDILSGTSPTLTETIKHIATDCFGKNCFFLVPAGDERSDPPPRAHPQARRQ